MNSNFVIKGEEIRYDDNSSKRFEMIIPNTFPQINTYLGLHALLFHRACWLIEHVENEGGAVLLTNFLFRTWSFRKLRVFGFFLRIQQ